MTETNELVMFVVYDHPLDFPDSWVVRRCVVTAGRERYDRRPWAVAATIEDARFAIHPHCYQVYTRLPPYPEDDPVIAEVWL